MKLRYSKTAIGLVLTFHRRLRERVIAVVEREPDVGEWTLGMLRKLRGER